VKPAYRLFAALACAALTACGSGADMKETLGLNRQAPDEFRVLPRPPLSVPPEFNLRPPGQESEYVSGLPAQTKAHDAVLGTNDAAASPQKGLADTAVVPVTSSPLPSGADGQLLADAGANKADPHIRQKLLDDKTGGIVSKDPNYLFGGKKADEPQVDPAKEAERLKQDKDQNQPPTAGGDTPVIEQKDKGILGDIF
jgi:hypothetical protein